MSGLKVCLTSLPNLFLKSLYLLKRQALLIFVVFFGGVLPRPGEFGLFGVVKAVALDCSESLGPFFPAFGLKSEFYLDKVCDFLCSSSSSSFGYVFGEGVKVSYFRSSL